MPNARLTALTELHWMDRMRRIVTGIALVVASLTAVATGAAALSVVPHAGAGNGADWPTRPYFSSSEIVTRGAGGSVSVHGSCLPSMVDPSRPSLGEPTLLGEYPYGGQYATADGPVVDPAYPANGVVDPAALPPWAFDHGNSAVALAYQPGVVQVRDNPGDTNSRVTLHPLASNTSPRVHYTGEVEYLVYSDSYVSGPIDLDLAAINDDASYDIVVDTSGLGVGTYTIRFLGCANTGARWDAVTRAYNVNYYQGTPNSAALFANLRSPSNTPGGVSYVPTNVRSANDPAFPGSAGQIALGYDTYQCVYLPDEHPTDPTKVEGEQFPILSMDRHEVSGRGPNEFGRPNELFGDADNLSCPTYTVTVPGEVPPLTSGYNGSTDFSCLNAYNNAQAYGGSVGQTPYPSNPRTSAPGSCPSGFDPVGIRANSVFDYYGRFQVVAPGAASPGPASASSPAFVAPLPAPAAAAATQAVITAAGNAASTPIPVSVAAVPAATAPSPTNAIPVLAVIPVVTPAPAVPIPVVPWLQASPVSLPSGSSKSVVPLSAGAGVGASTGRVSTRGAVVKTVTPTSSPAAATKKTAGRKDAPAPKKSVPAKKR